MTPETMTRADLDPARAARIVITKSVDHIAVGTVFEWDEAQGGYVNVEEIPAYPGSEWCGEMWEARDAFPARELGVKPTETRLLSKHFKAAE